MSEPTIGELFAGYGGLGMGVQAAIGGRIAWFSEFDKGPSKILAHRFPDVPNHGDITKIDWSTVEPVDILTGGSPCQDLSHAGRRAGMTEGTRSNLWVAMREAIAQLKPRLVVWENVGGAFSAAADSEVEPCAGCVGDGSGTHLRALGRVLGDLASLGFDAEWVALRAADVGAPHGRLRVFVTAHPNDTGRSKQRRAIPVREEHTPAQHTGFGALTLRTPSVQVDELERVSVDVVDNGVPIGRPIAAHQVDPSSHQSLAHNGLDGGQVGRGLASGEQGESSHSPSLFARSTVVNDLAAKLLPTPRAGDGEKGGPNQAGSSGDLMLPSAVQPEQWGQYAAAIHRWESLTRPAPAPTETGPKGNPRLSAAFSEWMMGLPAGWVTDVPGITRNEALKALGNGVVPQQAAAALRVLLGASERAA